ncbi:CDP-alcohol phosphatidyltransferase family protein [Blastococcus sp. SYSU D00820]
MTSSKGQPAAARAPAAGTAGTTVATPVDRNELPDRVWTLPNALSVLRLLGVPLFLWLLLGPQADGWAVIVLMVSGFTDWADGKLARVLGQSSRLGALLDPAADRLYIVATLIAFVLRDVVPLWVVAVLVGREVVLGVMLLVLRRYGYPPLQVHYLGKAATFILLYAFPLLLLADGDGPLVAVAQPVAWALTIWGGVLYVVAGLLYVVQVLGLVRAERAAGALRTPS